MARATVNGLTIAYEVIGEGRPWVITPGGRFSKDSPGVRELAEALAADGQPGAHLGPAQLRRVRRVLHRPVRVGHAGRRAGRPARAPRPGAGGDRRRLGRRRGCRCSPPPATPSVAAGLAVWWISGGRLRAHESWACTTAGRALVRPPGQAAWRRSPRCPSGSEVIERQPAEPAARSSTRTGPSSSPPWSGGCSRTARAATTWCPGCSAADARALDLPALVFRSGESDAYHTRATSEQVADAAPERAAGGTAVGRPRVDRALGGSPGEREPLRALAPAGAAIGRMVARRFRVRRQSMNCARLVPTSTGVYFSSSGRTSLPSSSMVLSVLSPEWYPNCT